jgi:hypothetical protein
MVDKSSHYESLATYVDDILIWNMDPMAVIKSVGKHKCEKECRYSKMLFIWECGITWRIMEESGIRIRSFYKIYIQNFISKFEGLFGKEFKPIKTPMSERYHPEVDDSPLCT